MRSDRYKKPEELSTRKDKRDHAEFWAGTPAGETGSQTPEPKGSGAGSFLRSLLIDVVIAAALAAAVLYFIRPTIVKQTSMENTIDEESGKDKLLIKRVIGLPGDKITIIDGQLYINDDAYMEDYLKDGYTPAFEIPPEGESYTVPDNSYFCMGDNRVGSVDSRRSSVGCVSRDLIKGKVVIRLFPFNKIQTF